MYLKDRVTGILVVFITGFYNILFVLIGDFTRNFIFTYSIPSVSGIILGLSVAVVVCRSIDLKKTQTGIWSKKGRGFDITGIILGGLFILVISGMILIDVLVPGQ